VIGDQRTSAVSSAFGVDRTVCPSIITVTPVAPSGRRGVRVNESDGVGLPSG
jgi:hypothetical protein